MSYLYATQRQEIFTESGRILFLKIRENARRRLEFAGAVRIQEMVGDVTGNSWDMLACVDRLVELGLICEITPQPYPFADQHRVFVSAIYGSWPPVSG